MNLKLSKSMHKNLEHLGYTKLTPIQEASIPIILEKKDLIAQAKTGSGKSAAFGIGVVEQINIKRNGVAALILAPTRELAGQITKEMRRIARAKQNCKVLLLSGGESFGYQLSSLKHEAHIVVGTPGRVLKHLKKGSLKIDKLNILVLDEADRVLDMGFIEEISNIISFSPKSRQTLLFSATFSDEVLNISKEFQKSAVKIEIKESEQPRDIKEYFYKASIDKKDTLLNILGKYKPKSSIIFINQKYLCDEIADFLYQNRIDAVALHGDMEQFDRTQTLIEFANGSATVLVATDVAARGVDIKDVEMVINYDIPNSKEIYTHRIGRTARAGKSGVAVTIFNNTQEQILKDIALEFKEGLSIEKQEPFSIEAKNKTVCIYGGRKDKLRAGDILGALAKDAKIDPNAIGKIDLGDRFTYVAINNQFIDKAFEYLQNGKIKNMKFRVQRV